MTELWMMTEHSPFMMGFVFLTDAGRAVVIDGGRPADMPHLFSLVGDRPISAWILTHPHYDHISGFTDIVTDEAVRERIGKIYYNFPSSAYALRGEPDYSEQAPCSSLDFERIYPLIRDKAVKVAPGMQVDIDGLHFDFLFCGEERYSAPKPNLAVNESSIVFRVDAPGMKSVLFLGDLGPEGGKDLLAWCRDKLPAGIVQMAHHGHSGVGLDVYRAIAPEACMWCAPLWLYEEEDVEFEPDLWGTKHTRKWMDELGVRTHYVSGEGLQKIALY